MFFIFCFYFVLSLSKKPVGFIPKRSDDRFGTDSPVFLFLLQRYVEFLHNKFTQQTISVKYDITYCQLVELI